MSPTFYLFVVIIVCWYATSRQLTVMQRTLTSIEEKLKSLHKLEESRVEQVSGKLEDALAVLRGEIRKDLQFEIELHEVRTRD